MCVWVGGGGGGGEGALIFSESVAQILILFTNTDGCPWYIRSMNTVSKTYHVKHFCFTVDKGEMLP